MTPQILEERLVDFAVTIVGIVESLPNTKAGNHIASQLIRSGMARWYHLFDLYCGRESHAPLESIFQMMQLTF